MRTTQIHMIIILKHMIRIPMRRIGKIHRKLTIGMWYQSSNIERRKMT